MTPESKASNSLRTGEHLRPPSLGPQIWFLAFAPPPRFSRHSGNGNKYPQSSRNQSFPSCTSIPSGREAHCPVETHRLPLLPHAHSP